jgi:hypothetical protein
MAMRILDYQVRHHRRLRREEQKKSPYATEWLNFLGEVLLEEQRDASRLLDVVDDKAMELADALEQADYQEAAEVLRDDRGESNPVWRLAEALTLLQGRSGTREKLRKSIDSSFHMGRPNGLAQKRRVTKTSASGTRTSRDARSVIFTNAMLDYLVHRLVLHNGKHATIHWRPLPLHEFLHRLREDYGLYVDMAPPGMDVSNELLQRNRAVLERRLRDLGLLRGVNDAESMKSLEPHFEPNNEGGTHDLD